MTKSCKIQWLKDTTGHTQLTFKFLKNLEETLIISKVTATEKLTFATYSHEVV
jgi:hypothetical protein